MKRNVLVSVPVVVVKDPDRKRKRERAYLVHGCGLWPIIAGKSRQQHRETTGHINSTAKSREPVTNACISIISLLPPPL